MREQRHYSTMQSIDASVDYPALHSALHKKFGYNYQIESATFKQKFAIGGVEEILLEIKNIGVAPMYYDWQMQFALLADDDIPVLVTPGVGHALTSLMPDQQQTFSGNFDLAGSKPGSYRLAVRQILPGADSDKPAAWKLNARNVYILFANDMQTVTGAWDTQNKLIGGWSILGEASVN